MKKSLLTYFPFGPAALRPYTLQIPRGDPTHQKISCLLLFLLAFQDVGVAGAQHQIHKWHIFCWCCRGCWSPCCPRTWGASSSGGLGPQNPRTPNRHSNTSAGCILSAGAVGAAGPHVVLKAGGVGVGGFGFWGLGPQTSRSKCLPPPTHTHTHTAHSTQHTTQHTAHNHNTTPHTTTTPQHHNTHRTHNTHNHKTTTHNTAHNHNSTPHTTTTPHHHSTHDHKTTTHNTQHNTQHTTHEHTAAQSHSTHTTQEEEEEEEWPNLKPWAPTQELAGGHHNPHTQHTAQHKEHNTAPHTANAGMGPPWVKLRHRVGWSRPMGGTKGLGFPLLAQQD